MTFNDLLASVGIDPKDTALALHKPSSEPKRRAICILADREPDLFDAYQSTHSPIQQGTLKKRRFMASFVGRNHAELTFCGLFENRGSTFRTAAELDADPVMGRMQARFGPARFASRVPAGREQFDLPLLDPLKGLIGRLVVADPMQRNYMRLAETTPLGVIEVTRERHLLPDMPRWDALFLTRDDLLTLPFNWALKLEEWCGVYLIVDRKSRERYVGSAYGTTNLLGRWQTHVAGDFGVTNELAQHRTDGFRFSILQLLHHDTPVSEVTQIEHAWMRRLDTIESGLNFKPAGDPLQDTPAP